MARPAIFLDRDGTLIEDANYLSRIEQVKLLPGAAEAVKLWNDAGWPVILITNQSGVARGYFPEERVHEVHRHLKLLLAEHGARLDAVYYCPHHPEGIVKEYRKPCECRKPRPGMILQAALEHDIDLSRSVMIGDKVDDMHAAEAAGCYGLYVDDSHGLAAHAKAICLGTLNGVIHREP